MRCYVVLIIELGFIVCLKEFNISLVFGGGNITLKLSGVAAVCHVRLERLVMLRFPLTSYPAYDKIMVNN